MTAATGDAHDRPRVSVVVPVHNAAATLDACLHALVAACPFDLGEVLVVDDQSTDNSRAIAESRGVRTIANPRGRGPAAARNVGAERSRGEVIFFVDADVIVQPTTIVDLLAVFDANPDVAAVFGSYDDEPGATNFLSQYKNLLHHFTHQTSRPRSASFWAGCGAVRRAAFEAVGGFDEATYTRPSIEDIELGSRLNRAGFGVLLEPTLFVRHEKRWTTLSLLKADILDRAYPWSAMLVSGDVIPNDLNLRWSARLSAVLVGLLALTLPFLGLGHRQIYSLPAFDLALGAALLAVVNIVLLNHGFYRFLLRARGAVFMLRAIPLHLCYYFYSGVVFVVCWMVEQIRPAQARKRPAPAPFA